MPPVIPDPLPPADSPETCVAIMAATPDSERTHVTRGQGGHLDTETGRPPPCLPGVGEDGQRVHQVARPVQREHEQLTEP
jgi:hypothetical protein